MCINPFEILHDALKPFLDGKKPPLNALEVGNLWKYLVGSITTLRNDQVFYNTVDDVELKEKFKEAIESVHRPMVKELTQFLKSEGVPLPTIYSDMPLGDFQKRG